MSGRWHGSRKFNIIHASEQSAKSAFHFLRREHAADAGMPTGAKGKMRAGVSAINLEFVRARKMLRISVRGGITYDENRIFRDQDARNLYILGGASHQTLCRTFIPQGFLNKVGKQVRVFAEFLHLGRVTNEEP